MNKLKKSKGFTLIELLVALAIVGIILLAFFKVADSTTKMNVKNDRDIKALNLAQSEIENLRNQIKNYEQLEKLEIKEVINRLKDDNYDGKIENDYINKDIESKVEFNNKIISIPLVNIPETEEDTIKSDISKVDNVENEEDIVYEVVYIKSIDDKGFKICLDISKSKINNTNIINQIYMYTINIKVKSLNKDFSEDQYFSRKETKIQNVKILSKEKS